MSHSHFFSPPSLQPLLLSSSAFSFPLLPPLAPLLLFPPSPFATSLSPFFFLRPLPLPQSPSSSLPLSVLPPATSIELKLVQRPSRFFYKNSFFTLKIYTTPLLQDLCKIKS
ncbi:hypothetical protein AAZX31_08G152500 [Glycine max]